MFGGSLFSGSILSRGNLMSFCRPRVTPIAPTVSLIEKRFLQFFPRKVKYKRPQKGRVAPRLGGSSQGTTVKFMQYGLRALDPARIPAKQLENAWVYLRREVKKVKNGHHMLRVFPQKAICIKGNEVQMGKGKGTFDHWAAPVRPGQILFEIEGEGLLYPVADAILKKVAYRFATRTETVKLGDPARVGVEDVPEFIRNRRLERTTQADLNARPYYVRPSVKERRLFKSNAGIK